MRTTHDAHEAPRRAQFASNTQRCTTQHACSCTIIATQQRNKMLQPIGIETTPLQHRSNRTTTPMTTTQQRTTTTNERRRNNGNSNDNERQRTTTNDNEQRKNERTTIQQQRHDKQTRRQRITTTNKRTNERQHTKRRPQIRLFVRSSAHSHTLAPTFSFTHYPIPGYVHHPLSNTTSLITHIHNRDFDVFLPNERALWWSGWGWGWGRAGDHSTRRQYAAQPRVVQAYYNAVSK